MDSKYDYDELRADRDLLAESLAVDLEPWLFSAQETDGRGTYYTCFWCECRIADDRHSVGDRVWVIADYDFLPLAHSIAEYNREVKDAG